LGRTLAAAGFEVEPPTVPLLNAGDPADSFSGVLLGLVARFVSGRQGLTEQDAPGGRTQCVAGADQRRFRLRRADDARTTR
jgi:hypothetical protein